MFTLGVGGLMIHYVYECPHKELQGCVCAGVCLVIFLAGRNLRRVHFGLMFFQGILRLPMIL